MAPYWKDLNDIMARLRGPSGCPWDKEPDPESLAAYVIEEAYEVVEAGRGEDRDALREELGDLLLQVVFQARIAEERGWVSMNDVLRSICRKMVDRHPHVFGGDDADTADEVLKRWERRKRDRSTAPLFDSVPRTLPALLKAFRLGEKAAQFGFDFAGVEEVTEKVDEETREFREALADGKPGAVRRELGDLFFALAQAARHLGMEPEAVLRETNERFIARLRVMDRRVRERGGTLEETSRDELEQLWKESAGAV